MINTIIYNTLQYKCKRFVLVILNLNKIQNCQVAIRQTKHEVNYYNTYYLSAIDFPVIGTVIFL